MGQGFAQGMFQFLFIYSIIIIIFIFNAMAFVPLGHLVSNLMFQNEKLVSYGWNLIGSIGGCIGLFLGFAVIQVAECLSAVFVYIKKLKHYLI